MAENLLMSKAGLLQKLSIWTKVMGENVGVKLLSFAPPLTANPDHWAMTDCIVKIVGVVPTLQTVRFHASTIGMNIIHTRSL